MIYPLLRINMNFSMPNIIKITNSIITKTLTFTI